MFGGTQTGVVLMNGASDQYEILAERRGIYANRIALREAGNLVQVLRQFRGPGEIGRVSVGF